MLLILSLIIVSFSCKTAPEIIIQKEIVLPQEVSFPDFPMFKESDIEYGDGTVILPEWLWIDISIYYLNVKKTEEQYLLFRQ